MADGGGAGVRSGDLSVAPAVFHAFMFTAATAPLIAWTFSTTRLPRVAPAALRKLWTVPFVVLIFEYAASRWQRWRSPPFALVSCAGRLSDEVEAPEHASCD